MCGIAGYFNNTNFKREILQRMNFRLRHRGPDGEGYVLFDYQKAFPVAGPDTAADCRGSEFPWLAAEQPSDNKLFGGFAHRRLAIVELKAGGHQPMCSADSRYWITYNGEIYNHPELREELMKKGYQFMTRSDTEVILAAWQEWGTDCLNHFIGMWSFAIYDMREGNLFAARDRFGVKPFYYYHDTQTFAFASEQKALLENHLVQTGLNKEAVFDYFVFGQIEYQPEGFFKNIIELPAAHYLLWNRYNKQVILKRYYQLGFNSEQQNFDSDSFNVAVERTRELLSHAVSIRMRADVEVGTCLSGGLDSSAIAAFMRKTSSSGKAIKTFTATFPEKQSDESRWAEIMAQHLGAHAHRVSPSAEELLHDLDELSICQDIPIWSTSTYAQFRVMKLVRDSGIKVVLDGQGGDELFAGYGQHLYFYHNGLPFIQKTGHLLKHNLLSFQLKQDLRYRLIHQLPSDLAALFFRSYFSELKLLNNKFYQEYRQRFNNQKPKTKFDLNSRLADEMDNTSLKAFLKCEDRCSMWFGIESRTPFADDPELIQYIFSLPQQFKIQKGQQKYLLRETIKNLVPEEIRLRKDKLGYSTPNNEWIRTIAPQLRDSFDSQLKDILDINLIQKNYNTIFNPSGENDNGRVFKLISFARWYRQFRNHLN